jgi:glycine cleavage system H lipoate-binding protein
VRNVTTAETILEWATVMGAGLLFRLLIGVAIAAALAAPVVLLVWAVTRAYRLWRRALGMREVAGLSWRRGLLHWPSHLWAKRARDGFRIGLDGVAQRLLPEVKRVALPVRGLQVRKGEPLAEIVTDVRRVPIAAPVDGTVVDANFSLWRHPERLAEDPYLRGWLVTLRPAGADLGQVLEGAAATEWFAGESARLSRQLEHELGLAAADGGEPLAPPVRALSEEQWRRLADAFLKAA